MSSRFLSSGLMAVGTLALLGVGSVIIDNSSTEAQILTDGNLGEYYAATAPTLDYGEVGPVVRDVQLYLRNEGYYDGSIDGIYGQQTYQAVREYQQANNLTVDGIVGEETWGLFENQEDDIL